MAEYTYKDVIIDPEDPRVEIGAEYYYCDNPSGCLERANKDDVAHLAGLEEVYPDIIEHFFIDDAYSICIIRKKEPEKKYVPFDLSKEETRTFLRGKWIKRKSDSLESMITIIAQLTLGDKHVWTAGTMSAEELLDEWTFLDGSPCGKQIPSK